MVGLYWNCCSYRAFDKHTLFKFCKLTTFFGILYVILLIGLVAVIELLMNISFSNSANYLLFFLAFYLLIYWFLQMNGLVAATEPLMSMKGLKWHGIRLSSITS